MIYHVALLSGQSQVKYMPEEDLALALEIAQSNLGAWVPVPWEPEQFCKVDRVLVFDERSKVLARHETTPEGLRPLALVENPFAPRQSHLEMAFDFAQYCYQRGFGSVQHVQSRMVLWVPREQAPTPALFKMQNLVNRLLDQPLHAPHCIEIRQNDQQWMLLWPNHCRDCGGYGQFAERYDPSPGGVSLSSGYMTDYEPCASCTEQGICPRCGSPGLTPEGEGPCRVCFWTYEDGGRPGYRYECECVFLLMKQCK